MMEANVTIPSAHGGVPARVRREVSVNVGPRERWLSAISGGALAVFGLRRRGLGGVALAAFGGALMARGATGRCGVYRALGVRASVDGHRRRRTQFQRSVTILRPQEEVVRFLREPDRAEELLQGFGRMRIVEEHEPGRMRIVEEHEPERISWRSCDVGGGERTITAYLRLAPGGRGTEVEMVLEHAMPAGKLVRSMVKALREGPEQRLGRALHQLKQRLEAGEIAVVEGQPSGRQTA